MNPQEIYTQMQRSQVAENLKMIALYTEMLDYHQKAGSYVLQVMREQMPFMGKEAPMMQLQDVLDVAKMEMEREVKKLIKENQVLEGVIQMGGLTPKQHKQVRDAMTFVAGGWENMVDDSGGEISFPTLQDLRDEIYQELTSGNNPIRFASTIVLKAIITDLLKAEYDWDLIENMRGGK